MPIPGKRSPRAKARAAGRPARPAGLTRRVFTYVTPETGELLDARVAELRVKEAAYIRQLIEVDLGLTTRKDTP